MQLKNSDQVREEFPTHTIFAGNVVTGEMVEELLLAGADVVKVNFSKIVNKKPF